MINSKFHIGDIVDYQGMQGTIIAFLSYGGTTYYVVELSGFHNFGSDARSFYQSWVDAYGNFCSHIHQEDKLYYHIGLSEEHNINFLSTPFENKRIIDI